MLCYYKLAIINEVLMKYSSPRGFLWYHPVLGMQLSETLLVARARNSTQKRLNERGLYWPI